MTPQQHKNKKQMFEKRSPIRPAIHKQQNKTQKILDVSRDVFLGCKVSHFCRLPHPLDGWGPVASLQSWEPNMKRWVVAIHTKFIPENATAEMGQLLVTFYSIILYIYIHMFSCVYICVSIYRERLSVLYIPRWYRISAVNRNSSRLLEPSEKRFAQLVVEFTQLKKLWVNLDPFPQKANEWFRKINKKKSRKPPALYIH